MTEVQNRVQSWSSSINPEETERDYKTNSNNVAAITCVIVAIAITTTMDTTGYTVFSALPLIPLTGIF